MSKVITAVYAEGVLKQGNIITTEQFQEAGRLLARDLSTTKIAGLEVTAHLAAVAAKLVEKHKMRAGRGKLSGADAVYLALAVDLAEKLIDSANRVILVTSDGPLYESAMDEPEVEAFHFWTSDFGSQCYTVWTPRQGSPHPPKLANTCPTCGTTCDPCSVQTCPSTYRVAF